MTFKKGFVISLISLALSASSFAMSRSEGGRWQDRDDHAKYRHAAYRPHRDHDHDRDDRKPAGWNKGKKEGWHGRSMPPGQAKKHHAEHRPVHHRRDLDRDHDVRAHHPVAPKPMPMGTRPVSQTDRNRSYGQNVQAHKTAVEQQKPAEIKH